MNIAKQLSANAAPVHQLFENDYFAMPLPFWVLEGTALVFRV